MTRPALAVRFRAVEVTRRHVLTGLSASLGAAAIGCGGEDLAGDVDASSDASAVDGPPPDAEITACTATSTLTPAELLAGIDTIVVLCMENRSFDHYLGSLRMLEGRADIDGLTGTEWNPDADGNAVPIRLLEDFTTEDPPHGWDAVHAQWNGGLLDGFVRENGGVPNVMGYHVRSQLPITYALADAGAICQRWFAGCLGPTWPNRFYLHGGTSKGVSSNLPAFGFTSIFDRLDDADIDNANYYSDVAWATGGYGKLSGLRTIETFFDDAEAGTLPPFSIIDPIFFAGGANDDHPDHDVQLGQALIASVVAAVGASPQWNRCLFVLTYDEHGGFYDHVPPPEAADEDEAFRQLGIRVPSIVLGPTVRRGCAIDTVFDHSSVCATAIQRWNLAPMTARVSAANDLSSCIDPRLLDDPQPPPVLPKLRVSRRRIAAKMAAHVQHSHAELADALTRREVPRHLDRRADSNAIAWRVLDRAVRLGAVELVD